MSVKIEFEPRDMWIGLTRRIRWFLWAYFDVVVAAAAALFVLVIILRAGR